MAQKLLGPSKFISSEIAARPGFDFFSKESRWMISIVWVLLICVYWFSTNQVAPTAGEKVKLVCNIVQQTGWGPIVFIAAYTFQPLVFFPTFLMTISAGVLYGPFWGMVYSFIGANGAATLSYGVGRLLGAQSIESLSKHPKMSRYVHRLRTNTFETILILGLLHAPFDLLNYLSGILRLRWAQFALATSIGLIPGGLPFVLFGASLGSVDDITSGKPQIDPPLLALSLGIALAAILASRFLRRNLDES